MTASIALATCLVGVSMQCAGAMVLWPKVVKSMGHLPSVNAALVPVRDGD